MRTAGAGGGAGNGRGSERNPDAVCVCVGGSHHPAATLLPHMPPCSMDFGTPDLLDFWLEPPDDVLTGSFLELGHHCPPSEVPVTTLQEQGLQGCKSSGGHVCVSVMNGSRGGLKHNSDKKPKRLKPTLGKRSGDGTSKIDINCKYPHVQGQKGLKLKHERSRFDIRKNFQNSSL